MKTDRTIGIDNDDGDLQPDQDLGATKDLKKGGTMSKKNLEISLEPGLTRTNTHS